MIWTWAIIAILFSFYLYRKNQISYFHFVWALLPIDYYGFIVGGVTIKLYMVFMLIVIALRIKDSGLYITKNLAKKIAFFVTAFMLSDLVNGMPKESVLQHIYFIIIIFLAFQYRNCIDSDYGMVRKAILYASLAYCLVFIVALLSFQYSLPFGNIHGTMVGDYSMLEDTYYIATTRFRGFESDPNAFCLMLIPSISVGIYGYLKKEKQLLSLIVITLSIVCIWESKSRSGLIVMASTIIVSYLLYFYNRGRLTEKVFILSIISCIIVFILLQTDILNISNIISYFTARSSLNDEHGRFTIWKESISYVWDTNPFLGIGANQVRLYNAASRACHNTWVEWCCSLGFIFGLFINLLFIKPMFKSRITLTNIYYDNSEKVWQLATYIGLFMMLCTIDYIANTYLLFFYVMLSEPEKMESLQQPLEE